jgi:hypothetical protein
LALLAFGLEQGGASAQEPPPDLIVDGRRVVLSGSHTYGNVVVRNRGRLEIRAYGGAGEDGRLDITATRIEIDRSSSIIGDGVGYRGRPSDDGEGPGGGEGGRSTVDGGGGGGYGGRGGDGVLDNQARSGARGGREYGDRCSREIERGSAGGAPGTADGPDSASGANGGGALSLVADTVIISGTITMNGDDGIVSGNDAAGGGSGGGVLVIAGHLEQTGRIEARGGDGGVVDDGGGGGGGGRIKLLYVDGTVARRVLVADGGRGDGNGYSNNGRPGSICIETIPVTATPTLSATDTSTPTSSPTTTPSPTSSPTPMPSATATATPTPTGTPTLTPTSTPTPADRYIPIAIKERCPKADRPPVDLVLVIDASTSMNEPTRQGRSKLAAALEAARVPIGMLAPSDRMAIVSFNNAARTLAPLMSDRAQLREALDGVVAERGSRLDAGIRAGAASLAGAPTEHVRHMVVLTDGLPNPTSPDDAAHAAEVARASGITISTIGLGPDVDPALLVRIAGAPERYYEAPDAEDLPTVFRALAWRPPPCGGTPMWPRR